MWALTRSVRARDLALAAFEQGMRRRDYWVYVLSSVCGVLNVGVTNHLRLRLQEHKHKLAVGFTARYNVNRLAERHMHVNATIAREKQVNRSHRVRKAAPIEAANRDLERLSAAWE